MSEVRRWSIEKMAERTVKALQANYFDAAFFKDRENLIDRVMGHVKPEMKVGFGGSLTVRDLGIVDRLKTEDVVILDHWQQGLSSGDITDIRKEQLTSDLFLSSANAITEKGELVNIDGLGNRTNSITYGPGKVIIIAGYNKIVPDIDSAMDRIKRFAAPMNAKRLNLPLPCAETGYCQDCRSEARICRIISILQRRPVGTDLSVFILNEDLGL